MSALQLHHGNQDPLRMRMLSEWTRFSMVVTPCKICMYKSISASILNLNLKSKPLCALWGWGRSPGIDLVLSAKKPSNSYSTDTLPLRGFRDHCHWVARTLWGISFLILPRIFLLWNLWTRILANSASLSADNSFTITVSLQRGRTICPAFPFPCILNLFKYLSLPTNASAAKNRTDLLT